MFQIECNTVTHWAILFIQHKLKETQNELQKVTWFRYGVMQFLLSSLEFVIQNPEHDTIAVWHLARSCSINSDQLLLS